MEAFYASVEAETNCMSSKPNKAYVIPGRSVETQKALQVLRDLVTKKFSLLLHIGGNFWMEDNLNHLLSLSPDDGVSLRTKLILQQISEGFAEWSLDYEEAWFELASAVDDLSKSDEVNGNLEANEEEIKSITSEIADFAAKRDKVTKKKKQVFGRGTLLKAERDVLRKEEPMLKAKQELLKLTLATIEAA
ncbi:hypothetical protein TanjilG_00375 [Lupinus angustifolius]|uniref:Uncharacterized protein n=1 Tax=Lupinus angustifolius TaxID=3871 RepID=A0A1J7FPR3_LUPAN|nr:hypothetical protein TanjilG_00375 [Lupinus angustifolius]